MMTPSTALLILGLIGAVCAVAYVAWRWGGREALAAAGGLGALALTAWAMLRTLRPLPERPRKTDGPTPPEADAAAREAAARRDADAQHAAWAREKAKIAELDDPDARTKATAEWYRRHRGGR